MFQAFLKQHDAASWHRTLEALLPHIHEVDRDATQIWFHFFPLELAQAIAESDNLAQLVLTLRLEGNFNLADQIDSSHWFLYGHRYWPEVKAAIVQRAAASTAPSSLEVATVVREIAADAAGRALGNKTRPTLDLTLGIAAVGLMTLQQVGLEAFRGDRTPSHLRQGYGTQEGGPYLRKIPDQIVAARKKNDSQGLAGMFRGIRAQYTVTFDERRPDARFTIINQQHLTTASANDKRDYSSAIRGTVEGPIPAQCRTQSCGTCWVGILGGNENLSPVDAHEKKRMREFGYILSGEPRPVIRLACAAVAAGNVTIVIPPWNGFIGKRKVSRETSVALPPR